MTVVAALTRTCRPRRDRSLIAACLFHIGVSRHHLRLALCCLCGLLANTILPASSQAARAFVPAGILSSASTRQQVVALSFDDGPSPYTPQILDLLRRFRAHATFFVVGSQVVKYPSFVRDERQAGDEIGNHTYTHADLQFLTDGQIIQQIASTQTAVDGAAGVSPNWLRPPYGAVDSRVASVAASLGLKTILWSVDPRDWTRPGSGFIADRVLGAVQPGSVVIMHDGGGDRSETVEALASILAGLTARHYRFLTLSQLFSAAPNCDLNRALGHFSTRGFHAYPTHAIFQQWENLYCSGQDLGPATGPETRLGTTVVRQNFATTAHRLIWNRRTGDVRTAVVWSWAARAFAGRGVYPAWHTPITSSWFEEYLQGHDWGPAQEPPRKAHWGAFQRFLYGWAILRGTTVTWQGLHQH
jgi:peptidoglycan/xylan/chitin deacetylase (PgdA/CDA1 family)